jgi:hypothetical protein
VFNDTSTNNSTITGDPTFNDNSGNIVGTITGNPTFNDTSYNNSSTITGDPTFNDSSYNNSGTITGDPTFNDSSYNNSGTITGNATFTGSSYNNGTITGTAYVRQHAAAFTNWRDYATSTYVTGTLTLQFPEMDILGTGLL